MHTNFPGTVPPRHRNGHSVRQSTSGEACQPASAAPTNNCKQGPSTGATRVRDGDAAADTVRAGGLPRWRWPAWMLDHDARSEEQLSRARSSMAQPFGAITRDDILDNITLYWLTNTARFFGSSLLGEQAQLLRGEEHRRPGCRQRLPRRALHRRHGAGPKGRTRSSSTSTSSTGAATLPPGSNRNCYPKSSGRPSARFAKWSCPRRYLDIVS